MQKLKKIVVRNLSKNFLNFIGTGGAFNVSQKNCSAFYRKDNKLLLIDCGESIFEEIVKNNILDGIDSLYILITHFHTDHVGSLGSLLFYSDMLGIKDVNVIYPNKDKMNTLLELFGVTNCEYNVLAPIEVSEFTIKEFKAVHSIMEAYSYLISIEDKLVYFSGDTKNIPNSILTLLKEDKIDEFYQDIRVDDNPYHMTIDELNALIQEQYRSRVSCMHYDESKREIIEKNGYKLVKKVK